VEIFVVDNASTDKTKEYLQSVSGLKKVIFNRENLYPGKACNKGWELADKKAQYLMRSDNDIIYKLGWDTAVLQAFKDFPRMGQLGIINELFQVFPSSHHTYDHCKVKHKKTLLYKPMNGNGNVGGPCVIKRELYDKGLRWYPDKWDSNMNEDVEMSLNVMGMGYEIYELPLGVVDHIGFGDFQKYPEYYYNKYKQRGLMDWFVERLTFERSGHIKEGKMVD